MSKIKRLHKDIHKTLKEIRRHQDAAVALHKTVRHMVTAHTKHKTKIHHKAFIKNTPTAIREAIEHIQHVPSHINQLEMHYQELLDHDIPNLELRVDLESLAKNQIACLKQLHEQQKQTLLSISQLYMDMAHDRFDKLR